MVRGTQRRLATLGRAEVARRASLRRGGLIGTWADRLPGDIFRNALPGKFALIWQVLGRCVINHHFGCGLQERTTAESGMLYGGFG